MATKIFTNESLTAFINEIKTYISNAISIKADTSHNHVISNVDGLQSALDGKAASGHDHNDTYYTETEVDTLLSGKANSSHTHTIANITNLQTTLDGKANTSHGTHVSYSTTAPVMDGSASVGTASTVARSDHKHPTDTSRAAQTSLDSHTSNKSNPHGVTLAQLGITATATELNKMDGVTATTAELNYVDGVTSNIQTQLNGKAASSHTHNTTYIPDTRSDNQTPAWYISNYPKQVITEFKTASAIGLSGSNFCKLTTYVQWANNTGGYPSQEVIVGGRLYTRQGTADDTWGDWKTNIDSDNIGSQSVNYATSAGSATKATQDANGNTITSTYATKTDLNGKASSSHTHNYAGSSSAGGAATSANKLNTNAGSTTQPVYFANGVPVATTYTLGKSVPSNAVFTDTNTKVTNTLATTTKAYVTGTTSATTNTGTQVFDTGVYLDTTAGQLTATTFNGTTFKGSGVATVSEVETYLGI